MRPVSSKRPYLIRAMHEWMTDNDLTPHVVVDAESPGVSVPDRYVTEGRIILNLSYAATNNLAIGTENLSFQARFGGVSTQVEIPTAAVLGIYAQETGQGMIFTEDDAPDGATGDEPDGDGPDDDGPDDSGPSRPKLKVVK
jgi:stringent starvation protein B